MRKLLLVAVEGKLKALPPYPVVVDEQLLVVAVLQSIAFNQ